MNCSPTISIAVLLLSLTAGMWLLYKTQKESLGAFFKVVSWFIIVVSFGAMIWSSTRCLFRSHCGGDKCGVGMSCNRPMSGTCGRMEGECGMGKKNGMRKRVMIFKSGEGSEEMEVNCEGEETDCEMDRKECSGKGKKCCADKSGKEVRKIGEKDTVLTK